MAEDHKLHMDAVEALRRMSDSDFQKLATFVGARCNVRMCCMGGVLSLKKESDQVYCRHECQRCGLDEAWAIISRITELQDREQRLRKINDAAQVIKGLL